MRKYLLIVLLVELGFGQIKVAASKDKYLDKSLINHGFEKQIIQIGGIGEFILDQGYPFKKQSVFGKMIIEQGRLDEFVLNQGYPFKRKSNLMGSNFKIIRNY